MLVFSDKAAKPRQDTFTKLFKDSAYARHQQKGIDIMGMVMHLTGRAIAHEDKGAKKNYPPTEEMNQPII